MTKVVEAIYANGVLQPTSPLGLAENQRVRLIMQSIEPKPPTDRKAAMKRLRKGIESMNFRLTGPLPTRDELHDRR